MNTDIRIKVSFRGHRKRKKLKALLGVDGTGYLIDLWLAASMNRPDGVLTGWDETDIIVEAGWDLGTELGTDSVTDPHRPRFVKALLDVGFLEQRTDGVYVLHDWIDHNAWASEADSRTEIAVFNNLRRYHPKIAKALEEKGITRLTRDQYKELTNKKSTDLGTELGTDSVTDPKRTPPSPSPSPNPYLSSSYARAREEQAKCLTEDESPDPPNKYSEADTRKIHEAIRMDSNGWHVAVAQNPTGSMRWCGYLTAEYGGAEFVLGVFEKLRKFYAGQNLRAPGLERDARTKIDEWCKREKDRASRGIQDSDALTSKFAEDIANGKR